MLIAGQQSGFGRSHAGPLPIPKPFHRETRRLHSAIPRPAFRGFDGSRLPRPSGSYRPVSSVESRHNLRSDSENARMTRPRRDEAAFFQAIPTPGPPGTLCTCFRLCRSALLRTHRPRAEAIPALQRPDQPNPMTLRQAHPGRLQGARGTRLQAGRISRSPRLTPTTGPAETSRTGDRYLFLVPAGQPGIAGRSRCNKGRIRPPGRRIRRRDSVASSPTRHGGGETPPAGGPRRPPADRSAVADRVLMPFFSSGPNRAATATIFCLQSLVREMGPLAIPEV